MLIELPTQTDGHIKRLNRYIEPRYVTSIGLWGSSVYVKLIDEELIELSYNSPEEAEKYHSKIKSEIDHRNYSDRNRH